MTSLPQPLPCPFCGETIVEVVEASNHKWRVAQCANCGAQASEVRWIYTDEEPDKQAHKRAITEWNTRAKP